VLAETERLKAENRNLRRVFEVATEAFQEKEAQIGKLKQDAEVLRRKLTDLLQRPFARNSDNEEEGPKQDSSAQEHEAPDLSDSDEGLQKRGASV
jgi:hypothetical protein